MQRKNRLILVNETASFYLLGTVQEIARLAYKKICIILSGINKVNKKPLAFIFIFAKTPAPCPISSM